MNIKHIKNKITEYLSSLLTGIIVAIFVWTVISSIIFRFRHPWATDMEAFLNIPKAFMLEKIPYDEMRNR